MALNVFLLFCGLSSHYLGDILSGEKKDFSFDEEPISFFFTHFCCGLHIELIKAKATEIFVPSKNVMSALSALTLVHGGRKESTSFL